MVTGERSKVDRNDGNRSIDFTQLSKSKYNPFPSDSKKNGYDRFGRRKSGKLSNNLLQSILNIDKHTIADEIAIVDGANNNEAPSTVTTSMIDEMKQEIDAPYLPRTLR